MGIALSVRETEKAELYPIFFFRMPHSRNIRKSVTIRYQIFVYSSVPAITGISRRDISTLKSLLVRLFYIYSRYVHFYIYIYVYIYAYM